ncbi:MAG TPA: hypothetical protein VJP86_12550 [Vicinamibacterales bacterium]|jgi:hypothetical protein|nr:hypothetical protein [Vicinamibacterales bacterium]
MSPAQMGTIAYRAAVRLYPADFRRQFEAEMLRDFAEATSEAVGCGDRHVVALWGRVTLDFFKSLLLQWIRTGLPLVALIAAVCSFSGVALTANLLAGRTWAVAVDASPEADLLALFLLVVGLLMIVIATICLTQWFTRSLIERRR